MGGLETEVTNATRNVLLEAAIWNPAQIRRTAQAFKLPSEASRRFERGVDPELPPLALRRGLELMRQVAGGTVAQGIVDVYGKPWQQQRLELTTAEVRRLLGIELSAAQITDILIRLGFECEMGVDSVLVLVPAHRLDVTIAADLVEEVARLYGYDKLPTTRLADELPPQYIDRRQLGERFIKDTLVACGLQEVLTYSFTNLETIAAFDGEQPNGAEYLQLENPLTPEREFLRRSILPELAQAFAANLREYPRVALFEIGRVFERHIGEVLPDEPNRLALVMAGERENSSWHTKDGDLLDYFDLKGVLETLFARLRIKEQISFQPADDSRFHPGRSAYIVRQDGQRIGIVGELHPDVRDRLALNIRRAVAAELDCDALTTLWQEPEYRQVYRQPVVYQDIAVIAPVTITAEQVRHLIRETAGTLLEGVALFDVYTGAPIPEGQRSLAFRMSFRAPDRTLADGDVNKIRDKITRRLGSELGATTRS
jgi:phenylalanyl-tRNA synthetase beta chain